MFHTGILVKKKNIIVLHILLKLVYFFGYRWYSSILDNWYNTGTSD